MAKDPAFLFYSQDFFVGVQLMSFEDRGKYITLLCLMHQHGRLSEETIWLSVGSVSVSLKAKFQVDENGLWYNERLENEVEKRSKYTESRRENGSKGGRPKREKGNKKPSKNHMDKHMGSHMENENDNEDLNKNKVIPIQKHRLQNWIEENCSRVHRMQKPITFNQANEILEKHSWEYTTMLLGEMDNYAKLTNYVSAYKTFIKWASLRKADVPTEKPKIKLGQKEYPR